MKIRSLTLGFLASLALVLGAPAISQAQAPQIVQAPGNRAHLEPLNAARARAKKLSLRISISPASPEAGQRVTFTVTPSQKLSKSARFTWKFSDRFRGKGKSLTRVLPSAGTLAATASVTLPATRVGASSVLKASRKVVVRTPRVPTPAPTPTTPAPPAPFAATFEDVRPILQANCMSCHTGRGWTLSESYFLQSRLVRPRAPNQSTLYRYLSGNPENLTPGSMPPGGGSLAPEQIAIIQSWITNITADAPTQQFSCEPTMKIASSKMKRLSKTQFRNSMRDLALIGLSGNQANADYYTWNVSGRATKFIPNDYSRSGHARLDDRIDEPHLEGLLRVVENFADRIEQDGRLRAFVQNYVPTCTLTNYQTEACRNLFLRSFGRRALKGGFTEQDYDFYRKPDSGGVSQATYREILVSLLSSPKFLYHIETEGSPFDASGLLLRITPSEFISRLSYALWDTLPDEQLVRYAEDGTVDRDPATVVAYVLDQQSSKSRTGIKDFFNGWLDTQRLMNEIAQYFEVDLYGTGSDVAYLTHDYGTGDLPLVADTSNASQVRNLLLGFRGGVQSELADIGSILTFVQPEPVRALFTTRIAPVQDVTLSRNYNLPAPWNGDLENIPLAPETRSGILTRTAFHLTRNTRKRPILIGALLREHLLCDPTGLPLDNNPPQGVNTGSMAFRTGSTHFQTQTLTEQPGSSCIGCHQRWLNPLGMAMGDFDTLGRRRNGVEWVFTGYSNVPAQLYLRPYSTAVIPHVNREDTSQITGTVQLGQKFADSDQMHACFTKNLVRFTLGRPENEGDGCMMNDLFADAKTLPMKETMRRHFLSPAFRLRRLNEAN